MKKGELDTGRNVKTLALASLKKTSTFTLSKKSKETLLP